MFDAKQSKIVDQAWKAFAKTTNVIVLLESIGLCVDDEKNARPCNEPETKMCDLYGVQDAAVNIIAEIYGIDMDSDKGDVLTEILEDKREDFFDYDEMPDEIHNMIIDLVNE